MAGPASHASWSAVAEYFQDRYHIIAPDLRGHGESDKPQTGYRLRDLPKTFAS